MQPGEIKPIKPKAGGRRRTDRVKRWMFADVICWRVLPKVNDNLTKVSILAQAQLGCLAIDDVKCPGLGREAARIMQGPNLIHMAIF